MLKQYVILPIKPNMSAGKLCSQTAHATFMALDKLSHEYMGNRLIKKWKETGMCVIVLETKDTLTLMGIAKYLEQWKIINHLYIDEGHTEIPMGTPTALATAIIEEDQQWVFETMKLYGAKK